MKTLTELVMDQINSEYLDRSSAMDAFARLSNFELLERVSYALELRLKQSSQSEAHEKQM